MDCSSIVHSVHPNAFSSVVLLLCQLVQDEIVDSFLDIKRHILERAREEEQKAATETPTGSQNSATSSFQ